MSYWSNGADDERIVFATGGMQLFTLDPASGALDRRFGDNGFVDLTLGLGREIDRADYKRIVALHRQHECLVLDELRRSARLGVSATRHAER